MSGVLLRVSSSGSAEMPPAAVEASVFGSAPVFGCVSAGSRMVLTNLNSKGGPCGCTRSWRQRILVGAHDMYHLTGHLVLRASVQR
jgi:hypothetical protein